MNNQNVLGLLSMLLASIFFSLMNACIKILSSHLSITQCMLFRSILMCLFVALLFLFKPLQKTHAKGGYFLLFVRAFCGASSMLLFFYNISTIPLGTASTFAQSLPLYAVIFAFFFLKETLSIIVIFATCLGFVGIILISNPSSNISLVNAIIGILSGITAAIALVSLRGCREYFEERVIILSFGILASLMSLFGILLHSFFTFDFLAWQSIPRSMWIYIFAMGLTGTLGQFFVTKAFVLAPAGIVAPLDYSKIVFSLFLGLALGDPLPNTLTTLGIILVITSGLLIAFPVAFKDFKYPTIRRRIK